MRQSRFKFILEVLQSTTLPSVGEQCAPHAPCCETDFHGEAHVVRKQLSTWRPAGRTSLPLDGGCLSLVDSHTSA